MTIGKIQLVEDLINYLPTNPFKICLDNKKAEKNIIVLEETLDFEHSKEINKKERKTQYSSMIAVYVECERDKADFDAIYKLYVDFYENLRSLEGLTVSNKIIESVEKTGTFGYVGMTEKGDFSFIMNLKVDYKIVK